MRKWQRNLLLASVLIVSGLGFSLLSYNQTHDQSAKPETVAVAIANEGQPITEDQAVKIAGALLGVDSSARHSAKLGKVTDNTVPFFKVVDLPVWTITFTDLAQTKPEFSTLTCLLDAKTGALLKVSSPLPAAGAVYYETHPEELASALKTTVFTFTHMEASRLADAGVKPLIQLLPKLENSKNTVQPAKHLVTYLGLYTGNVRKNKFVEHPCWLINTGGLRFSFRNGDVSDILFYVDATSKKAFKTRLLTLAIDDHSSIPD